MASYGGAGNDRLDGLIGDDQRFGQNGNDWLRAGYGNDRLDGDKGTDTLIGGGDQDVMIGGLGADVFVYSQNETEMTFGTCQLMTIRTFKAGQDILVITDHQGSTPRSANDAFSYVLQTAQSTDEGVLWHDDAGGPVLLRGISLADLQAGDVQTINDPRFEFLI